MVVTAPNVSTDGSLRVIARRRAICCTPNASVIVTRAGSPSGTAAIANPIAALTRSETPKSWSPRPITIITKVITRITTASFFPSASSERVSGVSTLSTCEIIVCTLPISVSCPVATTTPVPVPAAISVPE